MDGDRKLFPGTLRGYRHFLVERKVSVGYRICSPAYHHYSWGDGENHASCAILDGEEGFEEHGRYIKDSIRWTEEMLRDAESRERGDLKFQVRQLEANLASLRSIEAEQEKFLRNEHMLKECSCGFYASYSPTTDFYPHSISQHVQAVVECHGRVMLGTKGFRAQKMRVLAMTPFKRNLPHDGVHIAEILQAVPTKDIAAIVAKQFPSAHWFDRRIDMLEAFPEPDREGLVPDRQSEYGA